MGIFDFVNAVPVLGTIKGACHLMTGDAEEAKKAFLQSTRSTVVMAAGALGSVVGPVGAASSAIYAGALTDGFISAVSNEPKGIWKGANDIYEDIADGKLPIKSVLHTVATVGADSASGLGMSGILSENFFKVGKNVVVQAAEKSLKQEAKNAIISKGGLISSRIFESSVESRIIENVRNRSKPSTSNESSNSNETKSDDKKTQSDYKKTQSEEKKDIASASGSGSEPPRKNFDKKNNEPKTLSYFLEVLNSIIILLERGQREKILKIFKGMSDKQVEHLEKVIKRFRQPNLIKMLRVVIKILSIFFSKNLNFPNFLSIVEFVAAYVYKQKILRQNSQLDEIINDPNCVENIMSKYSKIKSEIQFEIAPPNEPLLHDFDNINLAVYHYFKHYKITDDKSLSVKEYYGWIRRLLNKLKNLSEYIDLCDPFHPREQLIYEVYVEEFQMRFRIVLKSRYGVVKLASIYGIDKKYENDKDGNEYIN